MNINSDRSMQTEDVALLVYASLVQKLHTYGTDDADRRKLAAQSFLYADAFLAVVDARAVAASVRDAAALPASHPLAAQESVLPL